MLTPLGYGNPPSLSVLSDIIYIMILYVIQVFVPFAAANCHSDIVKRQTVKFPYRWIVTISITPNFQHKKFFQLETIWLIITS